MKKIKFGLAFILFIMVFIFVGEYFMYYLDNFQENYYRANFYFENLPNEMEEDTIIQDFKLAADKNKTDFFTVDFIISSDYQKEIFVYGTYGALKYLKSHEIKEKRYSSLFSGNTDVFLVDFTECQNIKSQEQFYFIGDDIEKLHSFKADLIDKYGGGFPELYGSERNTMKNIYFVWGIAFIILLLLSIYDIMLQQKEYALLMTLGKNMKLVFVKNVLEDIVCFSALFLVIPRVIKAWTNSLFQNDLAMRIFLIFIIMDVIVNTLIFNINIKKNFSNIHGNSCILKINYGIKLLTLSMALIILSVNVNMIIEGRNYYKQKEFFENHSNYYYYQLNYKITEKESRADESAFVEQNFYNKFYENSLIYADFTGQLNINEPTILMNENSKNELIQNDGKWKKILGDYDSNNIYVIFPEALKDNNQILEEIHQIIQVYLDNSEKAIVEYYNANTELIGINNYLHDFRSKILKNPIVILDNRQPTLNDMTADAQLYYAYDILYQIPKEKIDEYVLDYGLQNQIVKVTNVKEVYDYNWLIVKRCMKMLLVISIILLFLEFVITFLIIKLEYTFNAIQMTLMKTLGYSLFERNRSIFLITIVTEVVSILVIICIDFYYRIEKIPSIIICSVLFSVMEFIVVLWKIRKIEKNSINLILKGNNV